MNDDAFIVIHNEKPVKQVNTWKVIIFILLGLAIVLGFVLWRLNAQSGKIRVTGYGDYFDSVPSDIRKNFDTRLYNLLSKYYENTNNNKNIEAVIREDSYEEIFFDNGVVTTSFLIDIDEYKQTYKVVLNWSEEVQVPDEVFIECAEKIFKKYPDVKCYDFYDSTKTVENIENNPLYEKLPIIINEFDVKSRINIHYEVRGYFNEDNELVLTVVDYSGGNLENAKKKVRELGYNPEDYKIKYVDQSGNF